MQPDLNLRRQRLAARLSQMVTAKPLGQLIKTGVVTSFVTLARHNLKSARHNLKSGSLSSSIFSGFGTDLVDSRELSGMGT